MSNRHKSLFPPLLPIPEHQQQPPRRNKKTVTMIALQQQSRGSTPLAVKRERLKMSTWGSQAAVQQANDNLARQLKIKVSRRILAVSDNEEVMLL